ncbi:MAG TPA: sigma 54-interacting transcriptional regulator, partial [Patescibacteria group bacterium]|nr:sigma 54-interacting transcriptional regulator [Patescibacteria group bacterium]
SEFGIQHIDFVPYAPGMKMKDIDDITIAITPGLHEFVPDGIKDVIDIGYRKIDVATINSIASKLGINNIQLNEKMIEYAEELCHKSHGITGILKNLKEDHMQREIILESIDDGIIITDKDNNILNCNKYICRLLSKRGCPPNLCPPNIHPICMKLLKMGNVRNHILKLTDEQLKMNVIITKKVLKVYDNTESSIIIIKDAEKIQNIEIGIRKSLLGKGYSAKYTFNSIVYQGIIMEKTIERAKKIALIDATTLIVGDTGTGKELFAQAIHNSSTRKNNPFVAINCAAISDNLLESELFGYEEGAFTGAKKGGKAGLFELAHSGTIFLDELGNISQMMQMKLLRVLQEKEVMRIGGVNLVPVNVRVIAATNENLEELVAKGTFRKDLYYRINNFTINLPPLKCRKEDIPVIIGSIMEEHQTDKQIDERLMDFLVNYEWKGNIRELRNCVEYLIFMGEKKLTPEDLPTYLKAEGNEAAKSEDNKLGELFETEKAIVKKILEICKHRNIGRRSMQMMIIEQGYEISEYKLRRILEYLKNKNLIYYGQGREGIKLVNR